MNRKRIEQADRQGNKQAERWTTDKQIKLQSAKVIVIRIQPDIIQVTFTI